jgi:hypothetical protein
MTRGRVGPLEVQIPGREETFLFAKISRPFLGVCPVSYPNGHQDTFAMAMRSGRNVDHSPPSSVEVKSKWSHTPTPTIRLQGVDREFLTYFTSVRKNFEIFFSFRL